MSDSMRSDAFDDAREYGYQKGYQAAVALFADVLAEAKRVAVVLPEPIWNDRQVLVWSLLDLERLQTAIAKAERSDSFTVVAP